jgi:hypothetical protein
MATSHEFPIHTNSSSSTNSSSVNGSLSNLTILDSDLPAQSNDNL